MSQKKINFYNSFFLVISLLCIAFFFYRFYFLDDKLISVKIYLLSSIIFFFFFFIIFFIKNELKINIILFYTSALISLYAFNFYLEYYNNKNNIMYPVDYFRLYDEKKKFYDYFQSKKKEKTYFYVQNFANKNNIEKYPLSGISNVNTVHCNENGYYSTYKSDRYGFNNLDYNWEKKNFQFVLIGDSMVHGACVYRKDNISSNLENFFLKNNTFDKKEHKGQIINLGWSGSGPLQEYATLKEFFKYFKTKNVIWFYYENDLENLQEELQNNILQKYLNKDYYQDYFLNIKDFQNLLIETHDRDLNKLNKYLLAHKKFTPLYDSKTLNFLFLKNIQNLINNLIKIYIHESNIKKNDSDLNFEKIINLAFELTKENNANFHIVFIPSNNRYRLNKINNYDYKKIFRFTKKLNINFIDIHQELMQNLRDPMSLYSLKTESHFTPQGFKVVSKKIYERIELHNKQ
jgi:hypothetical protein